MARLDGKVFPVLEGKVGCDRLDPAHDSAG
jgi:hypothetical protein